MTTTTVHHRAGEQSLGFTREFAATPDLVFRAHVEPELFSRWMGPEGTTVALDRFDPISGGGFRYRVVGNREWCFWGSYHEVTAPARIVHTWEFDGDPGRPTVEVLTFVDLGDGRTRLDGVSLYTSVDHCTEMLEFDESGAGMDDNFDRLVGLLAELT